MEKYIDERGSVLTEEELQKEFETLKKTGGTDAENFGQYLNNCLDKNGTLKKLQKGDE